jgi:hypothetical protein
MAKPARTTIILSKDLKRRLVKAAKRNHVQVLPLIRIAIEAWLKEDESKHALGKVRLSPEAQRAVRLAAAYGDSE